MCVRTELRAGVDGPAGTGHRFAPPESRRPVLVASHDRFERIGIDLRQCRDAASVAIYVFSEGGNQITWGGTLIVTTFSGAGSRCHSSRCNRQLSQSR